MIYLLYFSKSFFWYKNYIGCIFGMENQEKIEKGKGKRREEIG
jgi:predicted adenine nucleotide alpha hydrolase (AANH) superfamily ATPase